MVADGDVSGGPSVVHPVPDSFDSTECSLRIDS